MSTNDSTKVQAAKAFVAKSKELQTELQVKIEPLKGISIHFDPIEVNQRQTVRVVATLNRDFKATLTTVQESVSFLLQHEKDLEGAFSRELDFVKGNRKPTVPDLRTNGYTRLYKLFIH